MKLNRTDILFRDENISKLFADIKDEKVLTESEFEHYFMAYKNGDINAFHKLLRANLKFIISVAKNYQNNGVNLNDLINAGSIGATIALTKYDITKGKFSTYAVYYIRREINIQIEEFNEAQKYKNGVLSNIKRSDKITAKKCKDFECENTETFDELIDFSETDSFDLFGDSNDIGKKYTFSINTPMSNDSYGQSDDTYESVLTNNIKSFEADNSFRFEAINKAMEMLDSDEKDIIMYRFGINNNKPMTFEEISDVFVKHNGSDDPKKVTPECIRLKCNHILVKLKKMIKTHEVNLCEEL